MAGQPGVVHLLDLRIAGSLGAVTVPLLKRELVGDEQAS